MSQKDIDELNIRLNRAVGEFDFDILANEWDSKDLIDWGFNPEELCFDVEGMGNPEPDDEPLEPPKEATCPSCGHKFPV